MIGKETTALHSDKEKTLCFSGHRELPRGRELEMLNQGLAFEIDKAINDGFDTFLFGGAYGWDLLAAEMVLHRKNLCSDPSSIKLVAAIPFENQAQNWSCLNRNNYSSIIPRCDKIIILSVHYFEGCYASQQIHGRSQLEADLLLERQRTQRHRSNRKHGKKSRYSSCQPAR